VNNLFSENLAYEKMYLIRRFEESLLQLFSENKLQGTTHTSIGQEATAVAVMNHVEEQDFVFSNHRCHGHFIAYSDKPELLLSEIMGKKTGMCRGRGGSQHICYKHFYSNGVQGGIVPNATGVAFAEKIKKETDGIAVVFIGDGTLGQGVVYESFNMASLLNIPVLYLVDDNGYAMTTKTTEGVAGRIVDRATAFRIKSSEITSNDVMLLNQELEEAFRYVREERKPFVQVIHSYRLGPHSKGDDFREKEEVELWKKKDPLILLGDKMPDAIKKEIVNRVEDRLTTMVAYAESQCMDEECIYAECWNENIEDQRNSILSQKSVRCVDSLNEGLREVLQNDSNVILLGEDIRDPYGGAFKVTRGLTAEFSDRIYNTPISEAGFIGLSVGLAMNGVKPIAEMMFGDFITLGFDQLLNHATKYNWMYANQINVPMLIRIPSGGGRGYGATHSQSLEKYLIGIPNLKVLAVNRLVDTGKLITRIMSNLSQPTVLIENKKMYGEKLYDTAGRKVDAFYIKEYDGLYPVYSLSMSPEDTADVVIVTYGAMTDLAMESAKELMMQEEIMVDIVVHTSLNPIDFESTKKAIATTKRIITLEEGTERNGWGAEVIAQLSEMLTGRNFARVAAKNCVIPCGAELEKRMLPSKEMLVEKIKKMI